MGQNLQQHTSQKQQTMVKERQQTQSSSRQCSLGMKNTKLVNESLTVSGLHILQIVSMHTSDLGTGQSISNRVFSLQSEFSFFCTCHAGVANHIGVTVMSMLTHSCLEWIMSLIGFIP